MINIPVTPQLAFIESPPQLILILLIITVLFGAKKLPIIAKELGKGIREFKKSISGEDDEDDKDAKDVKDELIICAKCGTKLKSGIKFCPECGKSLKARKRIT